MVSDRNVEQVMVQSIELVVWCKLSFSEVPPIVRTVVPWIDVDM